VCKALDERASELLGSLRMPMLGESLRIGSFTREQRRCGVALGGELRRYARKLRDYDGLLGPAR